LLVGFGGVLVSEVDTSATVFLGHAWRELPPEQRTCLWESWFTESFVPAQVWAAAPAQLSAEPGSCSG